jgi:glycerophosphoryl diester phosphodiesterase
MTVPVIVAHRGYSAKAPENTLAAIDRALEVGARQIEWDIHTAACGTPVLFHDFDLERTTDGAGPIRNLSFSALQSLDAGRWFAPEFEGERIPSFASALHTVGGRAEHVYAEIKGTREPADLSRIARIASESEMAGGLTFISLDWNLLDGIRSRDSEVPIGYIVDDPEEVDDALRRAADDGNAAISLSHRMALGDPTIVERMDELGLKCVVWTVNDPGEGTRLLELGVSVFTTDEVERLLNWACSAAPPA